LLTAILSRRATTQAVVFLSAFASHLALVGNLKSYRPLTVVFLIVASQIFLMQLLFNREGSVIWHWWIVDVYSGAPAAALLGALRAVAVSVPAIQMAAWTRSEDIALMLVSWRVPYRYAMLATLAERFLPLLKEEYASVVESQMVRGAADNGIKNKIELLLATSMPFLYRAARCASEIALSMELRGFGKSDTRTFSRELHPSAAEVFCGALLIFVFCLFNFYFHI
jgi:energy-coupling factor transport system permease protein